MDNTILTDHDLRTGGTVAGGRLRSAGVSLLYGLACVSCTDFQDFPKDLRSVDDPRVMSSALGRWIILGEQREASTGKLKEIGFACDTVPSRVYPPEILRMGYTRTLCTVQVFGGPQPVLLWRVLILDSLGRVSKFSVTRQTDGPP